MDKYAIIVAGGKGTRMDAIQPKQFMELSGKPILALTIERFLEISSIKIILVLPADHVEVWGEIQKQFFAQIDFSIVHGGENRTASVRSGLNAIHGDGLVAIHDAVRPFVTKKIINDSFESAEKYGSGVVVVPLKDSLRKITSLDSSFAVDRDEYVIVQTPQTFRLTEIKQAYQKITGSFTDDATVYEKAGFDVKIVKGAYENIKITTPKDLA